jgi:hypothetical protein
MLPYLIRLREENFGKKMQKRSVNSGAETHFLEGRNQKNP